MKLEKSNDSVDVGRRFRGRCAKKADVDELVGALGKVGDIKVLKYDKNSNLDLVTTPSTKQIDYVYNEMKKLLLVVILLVACSFASAERLPGTKISINPPAGFEKANQFPGYIMEETVSSIMVTEMSAPFSEISKGFNEAGLLSRGVILIEKESVNVSGHEALILEASQNAPGKAFKKWMLILGDEDETVLVVATFPKELENELSQQLKETLLSVHWDADASIDFFEGLTFNISEYGGLKIAKKMGNTIFLTKDGEFPLNSMDDPLVVIGASITQEWDINEKEKFVRERLYETAFISDLVIIKEQDVIIDNLSGRRILAKGRDTDTQKEKFLYHVLLFTQDGYFIFQGFSAFEKKDTFGPIFVSILKSFKTK